MSHGRTTTWRTRVLASALITGVAGLGPLAAPAPQAQAAPQALPTYFILQNKAAHSTTLNEWVNDVHGHNAPVELTTYHHTPYHFYSCVISRGVRWCLMRDERRNCLEAARPAPHEPSGVISATCAGVSVERWRFTRDGVWLALLNQHYGQWAVTRDQSAGCELNGGCDPVIMFPRPRPWRVSRA